MNINASNSSNPAGILRLDKLEPSPEKLVAVQTPVILAPAAALTTFTLILGLPVNPDAFDAVPVTSPVTSPTKEVAVTTPAVSTPYPATVIPAPSLVVAKVVIPVTFKPVVTPVKTTPLLK